MGWCWPSWYLSDGPSLSLRSQGSFISPIRFDSHGQIANEPNLLRPNDRSPGRAKWSSYEILREAISFITSTMDCYWAFRCVSFVA